MLHDSTGYDSTLPWSNFLNVVKDLSGVDRPIVGVNSVDVYTLYGVKVRTGVSASESVAGLSPGIYVVNGNKVVVY